MRRVIPVGYIQGVARRKKAHVTARLPSLHDLRAALQGRGRPPPKPTGKPPALIVGLIRALCRLPLEAVGAEPDLMRRTPTTSGFDLAHLEPLVEARVLATPAANDDDDDELTGLSPTTQRQLALRLLLQGSADASPLLDRAVELAEAALGGCPEFDRAIVLSVAVGGNDRALARLWLGNMLMAVASTAMIPTADVMLGMTAFTAPLFVVGERVGPEQRNAALAAALALAGTMPEGEGYLLARIGDEIDGVDAAHPDLRRLARRMARHGVRREEIAEALDSVLSGPTEAAPLTPIRLGIGQRPGDGCLALNGVCITDYYGKGERRPLTPRGGNGHRNAVAEALLELARTGRVKVLSKSNKKKLDALLPAGDAGVQLVPAPGGGGYVLAPRRRGDRRPVIVESQPPD